MSKGNLKYMRTFAEAWPEREIVQGSLAQITWYHNIALLEKKSEPETRLTETLPDDLKGSLPTIGEIKAELMLDEGDAP